MPSESCRDDTAEANSSIDIVLATGLDLVRNVLVAHGDAVIAIGGGAGTLSEIAMAWMLDARVRYEDVPDDGCMACLRQRKR